MRSAGQIAGMVLAGADGKTLSPRTAQELLKSSGCRCGVCRRCRTICTEKMYLDVLNAGKDLSWRKSRLGIDLESAARHRGCGEPENFTGRFVRDAVRNFRSLPGAQRAMQAVKSGKLGRIMENPFRVLARERHGPDANRSIRKRQNKTNGEIGVMGDLGLHVVHVPFRLGWKPLRVYAQLQKIYTQRPDGKGGLAACDTWDNAMLHTEVAINSEEVPMRLEMKRRAPGRDERLHGSSKSLRHETAASASAPRTRRLFGFSNAARSKSGNGSIWVTPCRSKPLTGGIFEVEVFRIVSCRCGPRDADGTRGWSWGG